jgi:uncharacterized protein (TIGR00369 family)
MTEQLTDPTSTNLPDLDGIDWGPERSRTVSWRDPALPAQVGLQLSGLEHLREIMAGRIPPPPISRLFQTDIVEAERGRVTFTCTPDESAYNPIGVVHGGLVCMLLDSVAGCALHSTLPKGKGYTSVEIKVNYLKAVRATSGTLTAVGTLVKGGSRVGFTEGVVTDASGAVVATATSTLLVFDL